MFAGKPTTGLAEAEAGLGSADSHELAAQVEAASPIDPARGRGRPRVETYADPRDGAHKLHYTHDAMIDLILQNPAVSQKELAGCFGYTAAWVGRVISSDSFQERLAKRKSDLVDPGLMASLEERLRNIAFKSADIIQQKLEQGNVAVALKGLELSAKALAFGARPHKWGAVVMHPQVNVQVNNQPQPSAAIATTPLTPLPPRAEPTEFKVTSPALLALVEPSNG